MEDLFFEYSNPSCFSFLSAIANEVSDSCILAVIKKMRTDVLDFLISGLFLIVHRKDLCNTNLETLFFYSSRTSLEDDDDFKKTLVDRTEKGSAQVKLMFDYEAKFNKEYYINATRSLLIKGIINEEATFLTRLDFNVACIYFILTNQLFPKASLMASFTYGEYNPLSMVYARAKFFRSINRQIHNNYFSSLNDFIKLQCTVATSSQFIDVLANSLLESPMQWSSSFFIKIRPSLKYDLVRCYSPTVIADVYAAKERISASCFVVLTESSNVFGIRLHSWGYDVKMYFVITYNIIYKCAHVLPPKILSLLKTSKIYKIKPV